MNTSYLPISENEDKRLKQIRIKEIRNVLLFVNNEPVTTREQILIDKIIELEDKLTALQQAYTEVISRINNTNNTRCAQNLF